MQDENIARPETLKCAVGSAGDLDLESVCKEGVQGRWRELFGERVAGDLVPAFRRRDALQMRDEILLESIRQLCAKARHRGFRLVISQSVPKGDDGESMVESRREIHRLRCEEGGAVSGAKIASLLAVSAVTVASWRKKGRLLGWHSGTARVRYPVWQVRRGHLLPGLDRCLSALRGADDDAHLTFFLSHTVDDDPGSRPLDLLRSGRIEEAVEAALRSKWAVSEFASDPDDQLPF